MMEEKIELLKQWRDWHWHMFIWSITELDIPGTQHRDKADALDKAIKILQGDFTNKPRPWRVTLENIKYGEYLEK